MKILASSGIVFKRVRLRLNETNTVAITVAMEKQLKLNKKATKKELMGILLTLLLLLKERKELDFTTVNEFEVLKKENLISEDQSKYLEEFWKSKKPFFDFWANSITPLRERIQKIKLPTYKEKKEINQYLKTGNLKPIIRLVDEELSWFENNKAKLPMRFYFISSGRVDSVFKKYEKYFILLAKGEDAIKWWKGLLRMVEDPYLPPSSNRDLEELRKKINHLTKIMYHILSKPGRPKAPPDFKLRTIYNYYYNHLLCFLKEFPDSIKETKTPIGKQSFKLLLNDKDFREVFKIFAMREAIPYIIVDAILKKDPREKNTVTKVVDLIVMLKYQIKQSTLNKIK